jgi:Fe-S cluster assembly protein SufD
MNQLQLEAKDRWILQYSNDAPAPVATAPWLAAVRGDALAAFIRLGLPTARQEDWKYTSVAAIAEKAFPRLPDTGRTQEQTLPQNVTDGALHLRFVNGHFAGLAQDKALPAGVVLTSLKQALQERPAELEPLLAKRVADIEHGFTALNLAFFEDGVYLKVPRGVTLDAPVWLDFQTQAEAPAASHPRLVIVLEDQAALTLVEHYHGQGCYLTNTYTDIRLGHGAQIDHIKLQQEDAAAYHVGDIRVQQANDSHYRSHSIALGGALARTGIRCALSGRGADCDLAGLYIGEGNQHLSHYTVVDHIAPGCRSDERYKGILDEASRGVFTGQVKVWPDAAGSNARQANHNLLLSEDAEIDTRPQLQIFNDDVQCSHGATVGQLDADQLFYLQSRGLSADAARSLLTYAFAQEIVDSIQDRPLSEYLSQRVRDKLQGGQTQLEVL